MTNQIGIYPWRIVWAAIIVLVINGERAACASVAAKAGDFLNSIGVCTHISQKVDDPDRVALCLTYCGIRNFRDDGSTDPATLQSFIHIHASTGAKLCLLPINGDIAKCLVEYEMISEAGALLAVEGPNEPNNGPITYHGQTSAYGYFTTYRPVAEFQRDLYAAVKADPKLADIPVFASSEAGGSEPDNVGLQFLTIPAGSRTLMLDGTAYADFANVHNYVCAHLSQIIDNDAWNAEDPTLKGRWDGLYGEFGCTWHRGFVGYAKDQLQTLPRVTTETGWATRGGKSLTEDQQGRLFLNLYLDAFKRGWSYTFIYMLRDDPVQGYWGLVHTDYTPKLSGTYLHNLTTILADRPGANPGKFDYSIMNEPATVHDLLVQKGNGTYELAVWDEKAIGSDSVIVKLGATPALIRIYDPTLGTSAVRTLGNAHSITLTLSDHPVIIEIPAAAPGHGP